MLTYTVVERCSRRYLDPLHLCTFSMKSGKSLIQNQRILAYPLEQKGYKCFNPSTRKARVRRTVVFDELTFWYAFDGAPSKSNTTNLDIEEDDRLKPMPKESPISTTLSGPHESPSDQSTSRPSPKSNKCKFVRCPNTMSRTTPTTVIQMYRLPH